MYYQNLMNIKESLSNDGNYSSIVKILENLDMWLGSLSFQRLMRINPYQFALEYNHNERDVLRIFAEGERKNLFEAKYEVRNDDNDYIGTISEEEYRELVIHGKPIILYSRYTDRNEEFFSHNIEIWFSLKMKPTKVPETILSSKKEIAPPVCGDDDNAKLWLGLAER
ncbi:hypothetical protein ACKVMU_06195 [Enterococcus mundtii]|uniref:Uncharacterized protein n=1 Tax=Enterococcus mundtii TaxID=53346 RepID=A0A848N120_ENTMU|nr:hypothetical protein [Enterococcus mundtii]NMP59870.1 hypothetical protein [Enterococcus mundtii]